MVKGLSTLLQSIALALEGTSRYADTKIGTTRNEPIGSQGHMSW
jgi:hypothetical protein